MPPLQEGSDPVENYIIFGNALAEIHSDFSRKNQIIRAFSAGEMEIK